MARDLAQPVALAQPVVDIGQHGADNILSHGPVRGLAENAPISVSQHRHRIVIGSAANHDAVKAVRQEGVGRVQASDPAID